jgi:hypothetical protein
MIRWKKLPNIVRLYANCHKNVKDSLGLPPIIQVRHHDWKPCINYFFGKGPALGVWVTFFEKA